MEIDLTKKRGVSKILLDSGEVVSMLIPAHYDHRTSCTSLCTRWECSSCYHRSVASIKCLSKGAWLESTPPRLIEKNSQFLIALNCRHCSAKFVITPAKLDLGYWCSHGTKSGIQLSDRLCDSCGHKSQPDNCRYCRGSIVCDNESCHHCQLNSLATVAAPPPYVYSSRNTITPRMSPSNSRSKRWFYCNNCGHDSYMEIADAKKTCRHCEGRPCGHRECQWCDPFDNEFFTASQMYQKRRYNTLPSAIISTRNSKNTKVLSNLYEQFYTNPPHMESGQPLNQNELIYFESSGGSASSTSASNIKRHCNSSDTADSVPSDVYHTVNQLPKHITTNISTMSDGTDPPLTTVNGSSDFDSSETTSPVDESFWNDMEPIVELNGDTFGKLPKIIIQTPQLMRAVLDQFKSNQTAPTVIASSEIHSTQTQTHKFLSNSNINRPVTDPAPSRLKSVTLAAERQNQSVVAPKFKSQISKSICNQCKNPILCGSVCSYCNVTWLCTNDNCGYCFTNSVAGSIYRQEWADKTDPRRVHALSKRSFTFVGGISTPALMKSRYQVYYFGMLSKVTTLLNDWKITWKRGAECDIELLEYKVFIFCRPALYYKPIPSELSYSIVIKSEQLLSERLWAALEGNQDQHITYHFDSNGNYQTAILP